MSRSGRHYVRPDLQCLNPLPRDRSGDRAMKTTKPELEVPGETLSSLRHVANMYEQFGVIDKDDVLEVATPVVIRELGRLFGECIADARIDPIDALRNRIDELEAGA